MEPIGILLFAAFIAWLWIDQQPKHKEPDDEIK